MLLGGGSKILPCNNRLCGLVGQRLRSQEAELGQTGEHSIL